jgi:arabinose-5-phosphate isomerase
MPNHSVKTHFSVVSEILRIEAQAINRTLQLLSREAVERAMSLLMNCNGKVILLGVGKSGIVAHKIASTLTSTGTQAVFLHATDAAHGDLGMVTSQDVVIALSNSGETDELIELLPHLKARAIPIIAIVGNLQSTLAQNAYAVLDASVDKEACPLNLAPTTSTTVALVIGDALAMALMKAKGQTLEDFASNHPAGRLGKRLTLKVKDLMHTDGDNPTVDPTASWLQVIGVISKAGLGAASVVDSKGVLIGIITDGDLRRAIEQVKTGELEMLKASTIMTKTPIFTTPETLAYDALQLMENRTSQISVLPVIENKQCKGLLRLHDIVRSGL